jgi:hypothetical protein
LAARVLVALGRLAELRLGNLLAEPVTAIWDRYPCKANHFARYGVAGALACEVTASQSFSG